MEKTNFSKYTHKELQTMLQEKNQERIRLEDTLKSISQTISASNQSIPILETKKETLKNKIETLNSEIQETNTFMETTPLIKETGRRSIKGLAALVFAVAAATALFGGYFIIPRIMRF